MAILFIGVFSDPSDENNQIKQSKIGLQNAVNKYQTNFLDGLVKNLDSSDVSVINTLPVGTFPLRHKKIFIKSQDWKFEGVSCRSVGFINLPILKQVTRYFKMKKAVKFWLSKSSHNDTIIVYSLYPIFVRIIEYVKRKKNDTFISTIVTDLPSKYGIESNSYIKRYVNRFIGNYVMSRSNLIDSYVVLTNYMKTPLKIVSKPSVVIEGLIDNLNIDLYKPDYTYLNSDLRIILYSGTLMSEFGIDRLLDAFELIDDENYRLWICGRGDFENTVLERSKKNNRVTYYGFISSTEVKELQKKAYILINPRDDKGNYVKYSFPSKTLEYILTGKPVLMHKLPGIPNDYDEFLYYLEDDKVTTMANSILDICSINKTILLSRSIKQIEFVTSNKNAKTQVSKVIQMIRSSYKNS